MSEYDGPAFNKRQHQASKKRRFNRLTDRDGSRRIFDTNRKAPSVNHEEPTYYELPKKVRKMDQHEDLSPPVNREHLNARIENVKLQQELNGKESYSVPFLKKRDGDESERAFLSRSGAEENQQEASGLFQASERFKSEPYQPALSEQKSEKIVESSKRDELNHPIVEKSLKSSQIREVAKRLTKDKTSYLLFEYSKEH